jgi:hypothetical protein
MLNFPLTNQDRCLLIRLLTSNSYERSDNFDGEWVNGRINGTGTFHYADGGKYIGEWSQDKRSGSGM